jgi:hypothetical protein
MYILALHMKHFRSFDDLWVFPNQDVNVIVGPNNCGKTGLLDALALLLDSRVNLWRSGVISRFDFHNIDLEEPIELTVWLKPRVRQNDNAGEVVEYEEKEELVESFFDKLSEWRVETADRLDHSGATESHPMRLLPVTVEPMETEVPEHETLLCIRLQATWRSSQEAADIELDIVDQTGTPISPLSSKQRELLGFTSLPSQRDPVWELSLNRRSVLSQMLDEDEVTLGLRRLLASLDQAKEPLLEQESVSNLLASLEDLAAPEFFGRLMADLGGRFTLTFLNGELWRLRGATSVATVMHSISEEDMALPLEYQGDGAQNLVLLFHIIKLLREAGTNNIVALEEPEQNLEPALAKCIFGELCSLSLGSGDRSQGQILVTTHSPALVGELKGADSLLIFARQQVESEVTSEDSQWSVISGRCLSQDSRKKLDQRRERYINTLFSRQVLIVEGDSEIGFLPVAFRHFSRGIPYDNPYHLGLEVLNGESKEKAVGHAEILTGYGRQCHLLLDYDGPDAHFEEQIRSRYSGSVDFVTCWPNMDILDFAVGCDLEVILAAYVEPSVLFGAIKCAYEDAGHPLLTDQWEEACQALSDPEMSEELPPVCGDVELDDIVMEDLGGERLQRGFLFALLHGPHCCKAVKDMRMIADVLAEHNAVPQLFDDLRRRILVSMLRPGEINHDEPYLAARM